MSEDEHEGFTVPPVSAFQGSDASENPSFFRQSLLSKIPPWRALKTKETVKKPITLGKSGTKSHKKGGRKTLDHESGVSEVSSV